MTAIERFSAHFAECPLIAIIRGVTPDEVEAIGDALIGAGIRIVEVPLNSPDPYTSIARLAERFGDVATIGAGTVMAPAEVERVRAAGGRIIVSPHTDTAVIAASVRAELVAAPGYFTPSEAFSALKAGANVLKLFPAEAAGPAVVRAQRAVLPKDKPLVIVGGITPEKMSEYLNAGANGFGLGSVLYRSRDDPAQVKARAAAFIGALAGHTPAPR